MVSTPVFSLIRMIACGIPAIFIFEPGHYEGHHGIYLCELDKETFQFKGKRKVIWDGEKTRSKWIEAPHIYKKDGRYYLMCAEGGTGGWHSEVIFVSDHPKGPYLPSNNNPIFNSTLFSCKSGG